MYKGGYTCRTPGSYTSVRFVKCIRMFMNKNIDAPHRKKFQKYLIFLLFFISVCNIISFSEQNPKNKISLLLWQRFSRLEKQIAES